MNMTEKLITNGFKPDNGTQKPFNPKDNWMGVSVYYPDCFFDRGNKTVHLSVQGLAMPNFPPELFELAEKRALRYIGFYINKKPVYQNWMGQLPEESFIDEFIK